MPLRRLTRSVLTPIRRAIGTQSLPNRLDTIDERLTRLERQHGGAAGGSSASGQEVTYVTLDLPDGGTYQLAIDPTRRDVYNDHVVSGGAHDGTWRLLYRWVRDGDVVLDLGANIGSITIPLAMRGARVHAFELLHENGRLLAAAAARNGLASVSVVLGAVWDTASVVGFGGQSAWGMVMSDSSLLTMALPIDDYVRARDVRRVALMKLDVEGAEKQALLGARELLARDRPDIVFESNVLTCGGAGYAYDDLLALLSGFGYRFYRIAADRLWPVDVGAGQEVVLVDYLATTKDADAIRARCGLDVVPMTDDDRVASIVAQAQENDYHKACVVAAEARLPDRVRTHPEVAPLLRDWSGLRHAPFFARIQVGLGLVAARS